MIGERIAFLDLEKNSPAEEADAEFVQKLALSFMSALVATTGAQDLVAFVSERFAALSADAAQRLDEKEFTEEVAKIVFSSARAFLKRCAMGEKFSEGEGLDFKSRDAAATLVELFFEKGFWETRQVS